MGQLFDIMLEKPTHPKYVEPTSHVVIVYIYDTSINKTLIDNGVSINVIIKGTMFILNFQLTLRHNPIICSYQIPQLYV